MQIILSGCIALSVPKNINFSDLFFILVPAFGFLLGVQTGSPPPRPISSGNKEEGWICCCCLPNDDEKDKMRLP